MTTIEVLGVSEALSPEDEKYADGLKAVEKAFKKSLEIFNAADFASKEGWKKECENSTKDSVYSKHIAEGKLFAVECEYQADAETLFKDNWDDFAKGPEWNKDVSFARVVAKLGDHVDIVHYGNRDALFVIKSRDFLVMRMYRRLDNGVYMVVGRSLDLPSIPETKEYVRAEAKLGATQFIPKKDDPNVTIVRYLMCFELKGLLPKALIDQITGKFLLGNVATNKVRAAELMAKK